MKKTTEDITKCFKFDEEGNLYVDSKKIDPSCIRFKERRVLAFTETERERITKHRDRIKELNEVFAKNPQNMEIVLKNTKIFEDNLYLLIVYKKEVVVGEPGHFSHETYEEYEINYIVELKRLNKSKAD